MVLLLSCFQFSVGQEDGEPVILRCAIEKLQNTNPLKEDGAGWKILGLVYEGATKYNPDTDHLVPYIAVGSANESHNTTNLTWEDCSVGNFGYSPKETWEDSSKPEIIIFYDFESVCWHDDVKMSIRDIMFSFHAQATSQYSWLGHPLKDGANYSETQWLSVNIIFETEDCSKAALKFVLQKPQFSVFEYYLSSPILPYHIWGSKTARQEIDGAKIWYDANYSISNMSSWQPSTASSWTNTQPIGSGPFMWGGIEEDQLTLITWRKHFYRPGYKYETQASQPNIDGISFRFYDNEEKAIRDLEDNKLDYIAWAMSQSKINQFASNPALTLKYLKGVAMVDIVYNMRSKSFGYDYANQFSSNDLGKPLRRALAHCVDTMTINTMTKFAVEGENLGLYNKWQNTSAPQYSFDPDEAIRILEKAGYLLENSSLPPGNGNWWLNPDGSTIGNNPSGTIELLISKQEQDPLMFQIGNMVTSQMCEIGINIELVPLEINGLWGRIFTGEFEICIVAQDYQTSSLVPFEFFNDEDDSAFSHPPDYPSHPMPPGGAVDVSPYGPMLSVVVTDPDVDSMTVRFYDASDNSQIGVDQIDTRSGDVAWVRWHNLNGFTTYSWYATADDTSSVTKSPTWSFTTGVKIGTRASVGNFVVGEGVPEIYLQRPENYFYSSFHSSNIDDGPNFYGYQNTSYDQLIEKAMFPIDRDVEIQLVQDAVAALAYDLPKNHLYYQYKYEVHRSDNFMDYVDDGSGSLLNPQSMISIRELEKDLLVARFITIPLTAITDSTFQVKIRVLDQNGETVSDASILLESSSGHFTDDRGQTSEQGFFTTYFTVPHISSEMESINGTPVWVSIKSVSKEGYRNAVSRESMITVYPENAIPLSVKVSALTDIIQDKVSSDIAGFTYVDVLVTDPNQLPIVGASITVELDGAQMVSDYMTGLTDSQGVLRLKITATEVNETEECTVTITASKDGFLDGQQQLFLTILPTNWETDVVEIHNDSWPTFTVIISIAIVVGISYIRWKKGWKK